MTLRLIGWLFVAVGWLFVAAVVAGAVADFLRDRRAARARKRAVLYSIEGPRHGLPVSRERGA
jgi:hypothetical protein